MAQELELGESVRADDIKRLEPSELFSEAVVHGSLIHLSGQVAIDGRGKAFDVQTREVLERVDRLIAAGGGDRSRILAARIILTSAENLSAFNEIWAGWLPNGSAPARTTWIAELTSADFAIEIEITAARAV